MQKPSIKLWAPPPSPPGRINIRKHHSDIDISTPVRKTRTVNKPRVTQAVRPTKRQKHSSLVSQEPPSECIQPDEAPLEPPSSSLDGKISDEIDIGTSSENNTATISGTDTDYQYFTEAVLGSECAIYQLSERLFIANGWNIHNRTVTVRT